MPIHNAATIQQPTPQHILFVYAGPWFSDKLRPCCCIARPLLLLLTHHLNHPLMHAARRHCSYAS